MIGITQRVSLVPEIQEKRDCLAHDWHRFMEALGIAWVALPNHAKAALALADRLALQGVVLTGGDDMGIFPERDETELALLNWCKERTLPVLGVCRGLQLMHCWLGGTLMPVEPGIHRSQRHEIRFADGSFRMVNSYHNFTPSFENASFPLKPFAFCAADGSTEAVQAGTLLGIMWHPEREPMPDAADIALFQQHFGR